MKIHGAIRIKKRLEGILDISIVTFEKSNPVGSKTRKRGNNPARYDCFPFFSFSSPPSSHNIYSLHSFFRIYTNSCLFSPQLLASSICDGDILGIRNSEGRILFRFVQEKRDACAKGFEATLISEDRNYNCWISFSGKI